MSFLNVSRQFAENKCICLLLGDGIGNDHDATNSVGHLRNRLLYFYTDMEESLKNLGKQLTNGFCDTDDLIKSLKSIKESYLMSWLQVDDQDNIVLKDTVLNHTYLLNQLIEGLEKLNEVKPEN